MAPSSRFWSVGYRTFLEGIINPWRVIGDHELFMFTQGHGKLVIDGKDYICPPDSYIIIPSGKRHISFCTSKTVLLYWAHFDWEPRLPDNQCPTTYNPFERHTMAYQPTPTYLPPQVLHGPVATPAIYELHRQLTERLATRRPRDQIIARSLLLQELLELVTPADSRPAASQTDDQRAERIMYALTDLANQPFNKAPSVQQALTDLGQSYFHQARLFKRIYGITPNQYITMLRIERIRMLLAETDLSITAIATRLGYTDLAYFSRFFTKHIGQSPSRYRRSGIRSS